MRMLRGTFTSFVLMLTMTLVFGGCTAGGTGAVTLTFWNGFTGPDRPVLEELVAKFNETHPGVRVEMNVMPWDVLFQKMPAAYNAGRGPDLAAFDTARLAMYASRGFLAPVDDWYVGSAAAAALHKQAAESTLYRGHRYGLPFTFTPVLLFYNRKLFREAGLDPDRPPATWQEWQDYALRLTKFTEGSSTPSQYGLAIPDHECIQIWPILLWGNGGDILSADGTRPAVIFSVLDAPERNAEKIAAYLKEHPGKYIAIGHSKGAVDLMVALHNHQVVRDNVAALVSVAGAISGSRLIDFGKDTTIVGFRKAVRDSGLGNCRIEDGGGIDSMRRDMRNAFLRTWRPASSLRMYSLVGVVDKDQTSKPLHTMWELQSLYSIDQDSQMVAEEAIIPGARFLGAARGDHWALALPFWEHPNQDIKKRVDKNRYPRTALLEAIVRYVTSGA